MAEHLLFPTLITQSKRNVSEKEKIDWFDSYLENSNENGESMDYLGFVSMHHDPRFEMVFYDIANTVKEHLESLGIDSTTICVNITKSWFNVNTNEARNPIHDHAESHYSMTYYPHIKKGFEKNLTFYDKAVSRNEPYMSFLQSNVHEWNSFNARSVEFMPQVGDIFVFPSWMEHETGNTSDNLDVSLEGQSFLSHEELEQSRICIGCDAILTRKNTFKYDHLLTPINVWKRY
mgnify:FL=1|tara:strand:+ start:74 stop:772 length:699 start_codon:yes stop_codon:yes gene_type:complete